MSQPTTESTANLKNDAGKPRLELVPGSFLRKVCPCYISLVLFEFDLCWDRPKTSPGDLGAAVRQEIEHLISLVRDAGGDPMQEMLAARMDGVKKYAPFNWVNVTSLGRWVGAFRRHVIAQEITPKCYAEFRRAEDSGVTHIGHAICTLVFIEESLRNGWFVDDRQEGL